MQRAFLEGARRLQAGDYPGAERAFRELARRTDSARVRLELARTLFLLGRYAESRALFKQVLLDPALPWRVRDNVEAFLKQIDEVRGYVRFAASIVSDSNPRNVGSQREFTIAGLRLNFVPPQDNRRVTGLRYGVEAMQPLDAQRRLSAYFSGAFLDYPSAELDRLTVDLGLAKGLDRAGRARLRGGVEAGTFGGSPLYEFPYAALGYVLLQSPLQRLTGEAKLGRVNFPDYGYLDAVYGSLALSGVRAVSETVTLGLNAALERSNAYDRAFSYTGGSWGPTFSWLLTEPALLLKADLSLGKRDYAGSDPFFGAERSDRRTRLELSARSKQWRLLGFSPALVVALERNRSSIAFYEYEKLNASIALE